ncbi:hypothetical protein EJB10_02940 [Wolbachia endosymbiont of Brugia malayi]|nr:Predicted protein [Wolbachia endosymbiont strain TRS of Brugia malayi]QCB61726.1 hypothetical protein EJB10_02940 [Wolbachia endosymbiont of Brugia malayi]
MLGNGLLDHAIKHNQKHSKVIKFLLEDGVTTINAIGQEGRYYVNKLRRTSLYYALLFLILMTVILKF